MTLKAKLVATIASICLVIGIIIASVWAVTVGSVTIGGTVSFQAVDIYCDVTGKIENTLTPQTFQPLSWSAGDAPSDEDVASWKGRSLEFDDNATPIKFTISIKNNSPERVVRVTLKDQTRSASTKIEKEVAFDGQAYDTSVAGEVEIPVGEIKEFVIAFTFSGSHDETVKDVPYLYELTLLDENYDAGN